MTVWVDEQLKQETLAKEAAIEQQKKEAKKHINLDDLAGLSNQQINNYIDNNVTDLASAKAVLKKLAKWCRALTRVQVLRQDD